MSRSTLLGGGGEKTSRLKNSQKVGEADMADVFEQGFTQLSSKDRSAVRPIISYFLAWFLVVASEPWKGERHFPMVFNTEK